MATILLIEDVPDLRAYEAGMLEDLGHDVVVCRGSPSSFSICPLVRDGTCSIADEADLLVFSSALSAPVNGQPHRGAALLDRYREHPRYGSLPCLVVSIVPPGPLPGSGAIHWVPKYSRARDVVSAVTRLLPADPVRAGPRTRVERP